jgi:tetratricopeptide (TPR) repeat protein
VARRDPNPDESLGPDYDPGSLFREQADPGLASNVVDADLQWVLVPASAPVQDSGKRRLVLLSVILVLLFALAGGLAYQRSVGPIHALEAFDTGARLLKAANYEQAILSFDRAVALKPDFADAYWMRAQANTALSKPRLALADFSRVVELRPSEASAYVDRASTHLELEQYADAISDCDRAVRLDPALDRAFNLRGVALRALGRMQEALIAFDKAVGLKADLGNLFQRGATLQALGQHDKAIDDFSRVIAFSPSSSHAYLSRAQSYRAIGDAASADQDSTTARNLDGR